MEPPAPYAKLDGDPPQRPPVLVSACLVGRRCAYDGEHRRGADSGAGLAARLESEGARVVPFCPEEAGGLGTPRPPAWIETEGAAAVLDGRSRLVTEEGRDVTAGFLRGAQGALEVCRREGIVRAVLKQGSPSCGTCATYVDGVKVPGRGVTAELLERHGVRCEGADRG